MVKRLRSSGVSEGSQKKMINEAQQEERQKLYLARLQDIGATCSNFRNVLEQFKELEGERAESEDWNQYMRCDTLPKSNSPDQIRTFLSKIRHFEEVEASSSIDWTLSVDDRSVLTQNIFREDLTRETVEGKMRISPGPYFEVNLKNCLEVLRQVDVLMGNEAEMEIMNPTKQMDILNVYGDIQREIESLFDRLTYRVLAMQKAYMQSVDGIVSMWSHSCEPWRMDLWGLLNVPIIFSQMAVPVMMAELPATGVRVQMPLSILTDCLTLRCVHTSFDHHSEDAKSFEQEAMDSDLIPTCGTIDFEKSVMFEWAMQQDIQEEALAKMQHKREEYEDLMQLILHRTEQAAKEAKTGNEGGKHIVIPKTPKTVPLVPTGMFPEIYDEFIEKEEAQFKNFMDSYYHPKLLNLTSHEVNLREHIIVGGIYSMVFVERPDQTQFQKFNIILHEDGRVLHIIPEVVAGVETSSSDSKRQSLISEFTRASKMTDSKVKLGDNELPYFVVTIKLPPDLCKWGKPQVCHFLTEKETTPRKSFESRGLSFAEYRRLSTLSSDFADSTTVSIMTNQFAPSLKSLLRHSKCGQQEEEKQIIGLDFQVDKALHKLEIRALEAHCLPRIISSFKFPQEFNEEARDSILSKAKPNRLIKQVDTPEIPKVQMPTGNFNFSLQNHPERLFPHFQDVLPIKFRTSFLFTNNGNKKSANDVVRALNEIKQQYLDEHEKVLMQIEPSSLKRDRSRVDRFEKVEKRETREGSISRNSKMFDRASIGSRGNLRSSPSQISKKGLSHKSDKGLHRSISPHAVGASDTDDQPPVMVTHWTTRYIFDASIDQETNTLTFCTDRLGVFGLAFKRYEQFPFRNWCLQPSDENPNEVIFSVDTFHLRVFFYISSQGVRGYVTDLSKEYTARPVKYLEIKEPISDFRELHKIFVDKNINIFAENDASFYISNGYFSIKHVAAEMHTYNTMALHCKSMKFHRSSWNRLASRRDLIMDMKIAKDTSEYTEVTVRITPEKTTFVKVSELCSDNADIVKLSYEETWRNVHKYMDLNQAVYSINPQSMEGCNKEVMLFVNIMKILSEIRPLSFS